VVVIFGVAKPDRLIEPNGLFIATEVVPVMTPAPVIPPVPVAVNVIAEPLRAPPILKGLFVPVFISDRVPPVAVIEFVIAMPPLAVLVRLNPPKPAVEAPLPVSAMEFVKVTPTAAVPTV